VVRQLQITRLSTAGQWLLQAHDQAASEWAVSDPNATHVIDRTFVADGIRWIVDYKTTRNTQATAEDHRAQLERYRDCFGQTHPIQLAVFFTDRGELALLPPT
jgi:ATP-dependent exoDNAse (exonuclease V) beta subunit